MIAGLILYGLSVLFVGWLVYTTCDIYDHEKFDHPWYKWQQAAIWAPLWPLALAYVVFVSLRDGEGD